MDAPAAFAVAEPVIAPLQSGAVGGAVDRVGDGDRRQSRGGDVVGEGDRRACKDVPDAVFGLGCDVVAVAGGEVCGRKRQRPARRPGGDRQVVRAGSGVGVAAARPTARAAASLPERDLDAGDAAQSVTHRARDGPAPVRAVGGAVDRVADRDRRGSRGSRGRSGHPGASRDRLTARGRSRENSVSTSTDQAQGCEADNYDACNRAELHINLLLSSGWTGLERRTCQSLPAGPANRYGLTTSPLPWNPMGPWLVPGTHGSPCLLPRRESFCAVQKGRDMTSRLSGRQHFVDRDRMRSRPETLPSVVEASHKVIFSRSSGGWEVVLAPTQ